MDIDVRFPPRKLNLRNSVNGLKSGSCRFWPRTDGQTTMECSMPTPRDAYPGAQTCMDSNVVRAYFGSGLIRPRAQTCCAELRRLARLANSPGFKSFRCPRWRIKFSLERFSDPSRISLRAQPLKNSAGRVPQAADGTCNKISQTGSCRSPRTV